MLWRKNSLEIDNRPLVAMVIPLSVRIVDTWSCCWSTTNFMSRSFGRSPQWFLIDRIRLTCSRVLLSAGPLCVGSVLFIHIVDSVSSGCWQWLRVCCLAGVHVWQTKKGRASVCLQFVCTAHAPPPRYRSVEHQYMWYQLVNEWFRAALVKCPFSLLVISRWSVAVRRSPRFR